MSEEELNLWKKWLADQLATAEKGLPQRIQLMHRLHGKLEGKRCKTCKHFKVKRYARQYFKCAKSKITGGAATDWRKNWPACGKYEAKDD